MNRYILSAAMAVVIGVSLVNLKSAEGKLVFEDELRAQSVNASPEGAVVRYRDPVAEVNQASAPRPIMVDSQGMAVPQGVIAASPALTQAPTQQSAQIDAPTPPRSETLRRQRMREEVKNEDLLTQKLEELRLKDEMQRTQVILGSGVEKQAPPAELQEQRVGAAALEAAPGLGQPSSGSASTVGASTAPAAGAQAAAAPAASRSEPAAQSLAVASVASDADDSDRSRVTFTPRGGMSGITNSMYDVQSLYSAGVGIAVDLSDFISFQTGYTYSKYNLASGNTLYNAAYFSLQQLEMNDNVFDMGLRANFLPPKAKLRPFVGGGFGYRRGYVNFDDATLNMLRTYNPYQNQLDVELSAFMGYIETGLEFRLTKTIAFTGLVRYFNILSSRQTNPVSPYAFVNPYGLAGGGYYGGGLAGGSYAGAYGYTSDARTNASKALAENNFYQLMAGLSISF